MDEREFTSSISGEVRSVYGQYVYFHPHDLPFDVDMSEGLKRMSTRALINLSRLDGKASEMDEKERNIFMKAFTLKESTSSSSIEGTRSTIDDIYRYEKECPVSESNLRDAQEVMNYKNALDMGMDEIRNGRSIDIGLLNEMHRILLSGVRGENKSPGEFKTTQNAIGRADDTLDSAKFVPVPPEFVEHLMENLIDYVNSDDDPIRKIAIAHYQFESIHPYRDGNGRIGRLLIILMLAKENILNYPMIYPSSYFDRHRSEYIDRLFKVSSQDQFEEWFSFFIDALSKQAVDSMETIDLLKDYKRSLTRSMRNVQECGLIELIFSNPFIRVNDVAEACSVSYPTALKLVGEYVDKGILREITGKKRNTLYCADEVLEILSQRRYPV